MASKIASASAKAAAGIGKPIALRSISVRVSPPPVTFAERRSVLQALEQHGKVEFFKLNENHDSLFVSLMRDEDAASQLVATSPLRYTVTVPQTSSETLLTDLNGRKSLANSKPVTTLECTDTSAALDPNPPNPDGNLSNASGSQKEFEIHVWPLPEYRHRESSQSALHRSWPDFIGKNNDFLTKILRQSLPKNLATKGLSNWSPDLGMRRDRPKNPAVQERHQMRSWIPGKLWDQVHARREHKEKPDHTGGTAGSLTSTLFGPGTPSQDGQKKTI